MILSTHKIIESVHAKIEEFAEKTKEESNREPKDYISFVYYEHNTLPNPNMSQASSTPESPKSLVQPKFWLV